MPPSSRPGKPRKDACITTVLSMSHVSSLRYYANFANESRIGGDQRVVDLADRSVIGKTCPPCSPRAGPAAPPRKNSSCPSMTRCTHAERPAPLCSWCPSSSTVPSRPPAASSPRGTGPRTLARAPGAPPMPSRPASSSASSSASSDAFLSFFFFFFFTASDPPFLKLRDPPRTLS